MTLATRHEPIPLTPVPEGLIIQMCGATKPIEKFETTFSCSTCMQPKTRSQLSPIKKANGGLKCLACEKAAKNRHKPEVKLKSEDPKRTRIEGYQFSDLRWPTSRPVR